MESQRMAHAGLKEWGRALSDDFPLCRTTYLLSSLLPFMREDESSKELFIHEEEIERFVKPKTALAEGLQLLQEERLISIRGQRIYIGRKKGSFDAVYLYDEYKAPEEAPELSAQEKGLLQRLKDNFSDTLKNYQTEMAAIRSEGAVREAYKNLKTIIALTESGEEFKPKDFLTYLATLSTLKENTKMIITTFTAKDMAIAKTALKTYPTHVLMDMGWNFVMNICHGGDTWHTPTIQNFMRNKHVSYAKSSKKLNTEVHGQSQFR